MKNTFARLSMPALLFCLWGCTPTEQVGEQIKNDLADRLMDLGKGICQESSTGLMWTVQPSDVFFSREEAANYADRLEYGGFDDWRLPTRNELYRLHDIFYWKKNGDCAMRTSGSYWFGAGENETGAGYWETYYLCSPEYRFVESPDKGMVRAVRP